MASARIGGGPVVAISCATGRQGAAVGQLLLQSGFRVRALVRNPRHPNALALSRGGAELVTGSLLDRIVLSDALRGADYLFAVTTPFDTGPEGETQQGLNLLQAAEAANLRHVVLSSVAQCNTGTGIPHFESKVPVERRLCESGLRYTIVAPVSFMENWQSPWFLPALREGKVAIAVPHEQSLQHVSVVNLAQVVLQVLREPQLFHGERIELAADRLSPAFIAKALTEHLGRPFLPVEVSLSVIRQHSDDLGKLFEWFQRGGYHVDIPTLRQRFPHVEWLDFVSWVRLQDWSCLYSKS